MKITLLSAQFRLSTANCLATVNRCSCFILLILLVLSCKEKESLPGNGHILSFALQTVTATSINIDESTGRIQIAVAYGTVLNALSADIQISPSATIVPSGSVLQDFSRPVSYTVTAANGSKKVYTVMVSSAQQPAAQILGFSKESLRAGETLLISGKDFGSFGLAINAMLKNVQGQEFAIPSELIDSSHVRLTIPVSIDPAAYFVKIIKNKLETVSTQTIMVRIPAPEITAVKVHNILQGDSLVVAGSYIVPALHVYQLILVGEQGTYSLPSAAAQNGKLSFAVGTDIKAGLYTASLRNTSESVTGKAAGQIIHIYDNQLPFVTGTTAGKSTYKAGDLVELRTKGFDKLATRFYQVQLTGAGVIYNQNGVYLAENKTLSITLPAGIKPAAYMVSILFLSTSGQQLYEQQSDQQLTIIE